ncbi:hypothetical protein HPB47_020850 [Ixodes persulcatus]|uniref:Uncharacterized protein n=1 Tax=Ixodes persulcatus TaxID=34615 RepID=A0AC60QG97_IXOPE|nr:hypothetical protein HPB47_020850 [Ixodes persulcatus]
MYSVLFAGGVAVTSDPILSNDDLLYRIRDSNAAHILTTANEAKRFSDFRNKLDVKGYFSVGTAPGFVSVLDFKKLNEDTFQEFPVADVKEEVVALLFTSGTTGSPRPLNSHTTASWPLYLGPVKTTLVSNRAARDFRRWAVLCRHRHVPRRREKQERPQRRQGVRRCAALNALARRRLLRRWLPKQPSGGASSDSGRVVVTMVFGSAHWIMLLAKAIEKRGIRLDSLTAVALSGTKITPQILRQIEPSFDLDIVKDIFGSTEAGGICNPPLGASSGHGIGFPSPMVQIKVVDVKSGNVLGPNEEGEVLVKTPCSMKGYYGHPEATSQTITPDGWVRTGDICYYNEVGQFFYVERMSQFFRCMGIPVAPCSIESVLLSHDGIEEAAVVGVPHPRYQEAAMAIVSGKPRSALAAQALFTRLRWAERSELAKLSRPLLV